MLNTRLVSLPLLAVMGLFLLGCPDEVVNEPPQPKLTVVPPHESVNVGLNPLIQIWSDETSLGDKEVTVSLADPDEGVGELSGVISPDGELLNLLPPVLLKPDTRYTITVRYGEWTHVSNFHTVTSVNDNAFSELLDHSSPAAFELVLQEMQMPQVGAEALQAVLNLKNLVLAPLEEDPTDPLGNTGLFLLSEGRQFDGDSPLEWRFAATPAHLSAQVRGDFFLIDAPGLSIPFDTGTLTFPVAKLTARMDDTDLFPHLFAGALLLEHPDCEEIRAALPEIGFLLDEACVSNVLTVSAKMRGDFNPLEPAVFSDTAFSSASQISGRVDGIPMEYAYLDPHSWRVRVFGGEDGLLVWDSENPDAPGAFTGTWVVDGELNRLTEFTIDLPEALPPGNYDAQIFIGPYRAYTSGAL